MPTKQLKFMHYLTEDEAERVLEKYGIRVPKSKVVQSATDAAAFAEKVGYPIVLKVMSQSIVHKTDAHAVASNVWSPSDLLSRYGDIVSNAKKYKPGAIIEGVLVQKQAFGTELILGAAEDQLFGHTIMLGSGGIFAEIMKDTAFRINPISEKDAVSMILELRALPLLKGARGNKPANFKEIVRTLFCVSKMVEKERISELDINPLIVNENEAIAADARIVLE